MRAPIKDRLLTPIIGVVIAFLILAVSETALTAQQSNLCASLTADPVARIEACSRLIQTQTLPSGKAASPKDLAQFHINRGIAYMLVRDFQRAISDHEKALPFFPGTQSNITWWKMNLEWQRYLEQIEGDGDHENWSRPPHDGYWVVD